MQKQQLLVLLSLSCLCAFGQERVISSKSKLLFDSLTMLSHKQWFNDSLRVLVWGDSVRNCVSNKSAGHVAQLNHKIDSLENLQLPASELRQKVDIINQKKSQLIGAVNSKQQSLLAGTKKKVTDWQSKLKSKLGLDDKELNSATTDATGKAVDNLNVSLDQLNIQQLNLRANDLKIPALGAVDFQNLELPTYLQSLNQSLPPCLRRVSAPGTPRIGGVCLVLK